MKKYEPDKTYTFSTYIKCDGEDWERHTVSDLTDVECELLENLFEQGGLFGWSLIAKMLTKSKVHMGIKNYQIEIDTNPLKYLKQ